MHSEGTIKENDQIIYTRVGPDQIPNYQNQYVTIVGKVISEQNQDKITLDIGKGIAIPRTANLYPRLECRRGEYRTRPGIQR